MLDYRDQEPPKPRPVHVQGARCSLCCRRSRSKRLEYEHSDRSCSDYAFWHRAEGLPVLGSAVRKPGHSSRTVVTTFLGLPELGQSVARRMCACAYGLVISRAWPSPTGAPHTMDNPWMCRIQVTRRQVRIWGNSPVVCGMPEQSPAHEVADPRRRRRKP